MNLSPLTHIADNHQKVMQTIEQACHTHHRNPEQVTLLAVSKRHSVESIREALAIGQHHFGENYLNEAIEKQEQLSHTEIIWHYIGSIQSNKTRKIAEHFDWVHTVETLKVAQRLSNQRLDSQAPLNICLQINIDDEPTKSGLPNDESTIITIAEQINQLPNITLRGLMCIPAPKPNKAAEIKTFSRMQSLFQTLQSRGIDIDTLSMGMSNDLDSAIECGATIVRVGTAIFGQRPD